MLYKRDEPVERMKEQKYYSIQERERERERERGGKKGEREYIKKLTNKKQEVKQWKQSKERSVFEKSKEKGER